MNSRAETEINTIRLMVHLYCRKKHGTAGGFCPGCTELLEYAEERIRNCRYLPDKPTCRQCPVHCFRKEMRERIAIVMRFAGPRMSLYHPMEAVMHWLREMKKRT